MRLYPDLKSVRAWRLRSLAGKQLAGEWLHRLPIQPIKPRAQHLKLEHGLFGAGHIQAYGYSPG